MSTRKYSDSRVYHATPYVYIEPISLKEVHIYVRWLYIAWKARDIKRIRKYSFQILMWLCHGTRVPDCQFMLRKGTNPDAFGLYYTTDKKITIYLGTHHDEYGEWGCFREYLNTLVHEWCHHYSLCAYGRVGSDKDDKHDSIFYKRTQNVLVRVTRDIKPYLGKKTAKKKK